MDPEWHKLLNSGIQALIQIGTAIGVLLSIWQNVRIKREAAIAKEVSVTTLESSTSNARRLEHIENAVHGAVDQLNTAAETATAVRDEIATAAAVVSSVATAAGVDMSRSLPAVVAIPADQVVVTPVGPGTSLIQAAPPQ